MDNSIYLAVVKYLKLKHLKLLIALKTLRS